MEGDDISTRIVDDDFPKTIFMQKPTPVATVERPNVIKPARPAPPLPRLSWATRMRAQLELWWATRKPKQPPAVDARYDPKQFRRPR